MKPLPQLAPIHTTKDLEKFCQSLVCSQKTPPFIAIDTEFMRDKTYWPMLCLIQVADGEKAALIDPLNQSLCLDPLWDVLKNPDYTKVFHGARQDLEIFYHLTNNMPFPIFDTQVASMACAFGDPPSYEDLVHSFYQKKINKKQRLTNWAQRPLTPFQQTYALEDVLYLGGLYEKLLDQLHQKNRLSWMEEALGVLCSPHTYQADPVQAWKRLKKPPSFFSPRHLHNPLVLSYVQCVAQKREVLAQTHNVPRQHILKDSELFQAAHLFVAQSPVTSYGALSLSKWMSPQDLDPGAFVLTPQTPHTHKPLKISLSFALGVLKGWLKVCAFHHNVSQGLIATTKDLEDLVDLFQKSPPSSPLFSPPPETSLGPSPESSLGPSSLGLGPHPLLKGWRWDIFGKNAWSFLQGHKGAFLKEGRVDFYPASPNAPPQ